MVVAAAAARDHVRSRFMVPSFCYGGRRPLVSWRAGRRRQGAGRWRASLHRSALGCAQRLPGLNLACGGADQSKPLVSARGARLRIRIPCP
jgi:hypothetical protein